MNVQPLPDFMSGWIWVFSHVLQCNIISHPFFCVESVIAFCVIVDGQLNYFTWEIFGRVKYW